MVRRSRDLLRLSGTPRYAEVHGAAREVLARHLAGGGPHIRIADRRQALRG
ncbi:hypothetical protein OHA98_19520 [Streptomyces sp. NBC_00654]|uniref:hypothetical protein n=1 Tax=Streptomyces sp. NBC_00654 TaxID=2975799 RepID=UPI002253E8BC|nr:hypothetical protein [Streptomyces sp. NBC_00654]MCX4966971.1 hypothetical protein [Streptomyces sp. NBC_00654]